MQTHEKHSHRNLLVLAQESGANVLQQLRVGLIHSKVGKGFDQRVAHRAGRLAVDKGVRTRLLILASKNIKSEGDHFQNKDFHVSPAELNAIAQGRPFVTKDEKENKPSKATYAHGF